MKFDWTISLGNILSAAGFLILAIIVYKDMDWRVKNLETWRIEHMVDSDARDNLIKELNDILRHVKWQTEVMLGRRAKPPV